MAKNLSENVWLSRDGTICRPLPRTYPQTNLVRTPRLTMSLLAAHVAHTLLDRRQTSALNVSPLLTIATAYISIGRRERELITVRYVPSIAGILTEKWRKINSANCGQTTSHPPTLIATLKILTRLRPQNLTNVKILAAPRLIIESSHLLVPPNFPLNHPFLGTSLCVGP
jgi:hypothetical protein